MSTPSRAACVGHVLLVAIEPPQDRQPRVPLASTRHVVRDIGDELGKRLGPFVGDVAAVAEDAPMPASSAGSLDS